MPTTNEPTVIEGLAQLLADSYALFLKSANYHWNSTGPLSGAVRTLAKEHYIELVGGIDAIAEHIRALDILVISRSLQFGSQSLVGVPNETLDSAAMIGDLIAGHQHARSTARQLWATASNSGDLASAHLATHRAFVHDQAARTLGGLLP